MSFCQFQHFDLVDLLCFASMADEKIWQSKVNAKISFVIFGVTLFCQYDFFAWRLLLFVFSRFSHF